MTISSSSLGRSTIFSDFGNHVVNPPVLTTRSTPEERRVKPLGWQLQICFGASQSLIEVAALRHDCHPAIWSCVVPVR